MTTHYVPYAVTLDTDVIGQITDVSISVDREAYTLENPQSLYLRAATTTKRRPRIRITTQQVANVLGLLGLTGAEISASNVLTVYFAELKNGQVDAAGTDADNWSMACNLGAIAVSSINSGDDTSPATVTLEAALASSDGATDPWTLDTTEVALPTLPTYEAWKASAFTSITGAAVRDWSVDMSLDWKQPDDGQAVIYPTVAALRKVRPTATANFAGVIEPGAVDTTVALGLDDVPDGSSPITLTFTSADEENDEISVADDDSTTQVTIQCSASGDTAPITFSGLA